MGDISRKALDRLGDGTTISVHWLLVHIPPLVLAILMVGCSSVGPNEQRLVSKPNMLFADTVTFNYQSKLLVQTEPGSGFLAGGNAAGCTSCR